MSYTISEAQASERLKMNVTEINWTELTWNPASGCKKLSAGCKYCYAHGIAEPKRGTAAFPVGFDVMLRPWKLGEPAKVKRPSLIFTNSMTDMFLDEISDSYRDQILDAMANASHHRYQVLTKRPEIAARYFATRKVPDYLWLGTTVEHQATAHRIETLKSIDAKVRYVSAEPLLGPIVADLVGIHWLISGGESGNHLMRPNVCTERALVRRGGAGESTWVARDDRMDWVRGLRDQCQRDNVAFWHKQWGGSKGFLAGRLLDGRTWDEMPRVPGAMPAAYKHKAASAKPVRQVCLPLV